MRVPYFPGSDLLVTIMMKRFLFIVCGSLAVLPGRITAQDLTEAESNEIARTVSQRFLEVAEATNALDMNRLLALYDTSDNLTYVAQGTVTRGIEAFRALIDAQLGGLSSADVRFSDPEVDVLDRGVALTVSPYEFTATFPSGSTITTAGTYMCLFVLRDGLWLIRHSSHTFPRNSS